MLLSQSGALNCLRMSCLIWVCLHVLFAVEGTSGEAPTPYLPEAPAVKRPSLKSPAELPVALPGGKTVKPGDFTQTVSLDGEWRISGLRNSAQEFPADGDLAQGWHKPDFDDSGWSAIAVPLDWFRKYSGARQPDKPYVRGWYRRQIDIRPEWQGQRILLHFAVIGYEARLFVNGRDIGSHHGDFTPWEVDITSAVEFGKKNTLALRVDTDFGPRLSKVQKARHAYGSQWSIGNVKGGLWQSVELRVRPQTRIARALINCDVQGKAIEVDYVVLNNAGQRPMSLRAAVVPAAADAGESPAGAAVVELPVASGSVSGTMRIPLASPRCWSPDDPHLYYLTLALTDANGVADVYAQRFGFRSFQTVGKHFALNAERVYLYGENLKSLAFGGVGRTPADETAEMERWLFGFKRQGCNIIRNAHMPVSTEVLQIADEIGLMIYNEWAWCFTDVLDEAEFERRNLREMEEWLYRDYNHPSVVMWSLGNEVPHKERPAVGRQLDQQVIAMRKLDRQKRPVGSFSGSAGFATYGADRRETDFLDLHSYLSLSTAPWTNWTESFAAHYKWATTIYGKDGKLDIPYIVWECVGFSWGEMRDPAFRPDNADAYFAYLKKNTTWSRPNGIGFAGTIGLAKGVSGSVKCGQEIYGPRIIRQIRQNSDVAGFAPWFHGFDLPVAALWNQPLLAVLRMEHQVPPRNLFIGESYPMTLALINNTSMPRRDHELLLTLADEKGAETECLRKRLDELPAWSTGSTAITVGIPAGVAAGNAQLRLRILQNGREVSRNFDPLFLQERSIMTAALPAGRKTALLVPGGGDHPMLAICRQLGVPVVVRPDALNLSEIGTLIIPPLSLDQAAKITPSEAQVFFDWVRRGGVLLQMEQNYSGSDPLQQQLMPCGNTFVDLVLSQHPVFRGLGREQFDTWQNPEKGYVISFGTPPAEQALAIRGPMLGTTLLCTAVAEGRIGEGRILTSQLNATALWGKDSAATRYLRNLLEYAVSDASSATQREWTLKAREEFRVSAKQAVTIDLRKAANMAFADEKAGDERGGWTDQGPDGDFSMMPLGRQVFAGVPFDILDPEANNDKSAIVLRGQKKDFLPVATPEIAINQRVGRMFFLHTCAWGAPGAAVGEYVIRYADDVSVKIPVICGKNINDWWNYAMLPEALPAFSRPLRTGKDVGVFLMPWENLRPDVAVRSFSFVSAQADAVPVLIAVTAELISQDPLLIGSTEAAAVWNVKSHPKPDNPAIVARADQMAPFPGALTQHIRMPANRAGATPVAYIKFPKEKLLSGNYSSLSFWLKAQAPGTIDVVLPRTDWGDRLSAPVRLTPSAGWQKIRLRLQEDMGLSKKSWTLGELRGELFFYNNSGAANEFYLADIRLE